LLLSCSYARQLIISSAFQLLLWSAYFVQPGLINKKTKVPLFNLPSGIRYLEKERKRDREEEREKNISNLIACIEEYRKEEDHSFSEKRAHKVQ
jgi:hypothetical protein